MGERGQAWSMDLVIGVLVFMLAVGIIYSLLATRDSDVEPLRIESEVIANKLADPAFGVTEGNRLNMGRLATLALEDYEALKQQLGVRSDFCIFLRDEQGNLVYIVNGTETYAGVGSGSGELNLSGTPCGCKVGNVPSNCTA